MEHRHDPEVEALIGHAVEKRPRDELYDIVKDPACLNNLADSKKFLHKKKCLSAVLDAYLLHTEDPRAISATAPWDPFPYYFNNPDGVVPYSAIKQEK